MSEDNTQVEQITKKPEQRIERVKDPQKVAAGRRLVAYHKKAKQALKQENERETGNETEEETSNSKWMPDISMTTAISLIGISLTVVDLYFRWKKNKNQVITPTKPKIESNEVEDVKLKQTTKSKIPIPRIGME